MTLPFTPATLTDSPTVTRNAAYWFATVIKPVSDAVMQVLGTPFITRPLLGLWQAYGGGYATPGYRQFDKRVVLSGLVTGGGIGVGNPILQMPAALCPAFIKSFNCIANTGVAAVSLDTNGNLYVVAYAYGGTNAYVALDGIEYWLD